ncbi:ATP synthase F1 subunit gamma [Helicobacter mustelae]|uniref:ATP synthase gamma chain n=1 Tax=Helicobacter mustelae (strain ATCC 43772 / CCUG 25715 / CIP 103759 / LMG 18044 / NCTC 12198 / R85-136P) TaxID=679897 RepID=D3UGS5_HELM1|nr:ATP synthase F1 subunit gamma [Helicobacter mustelae]CBG39696.1 ATP synthase F1 sector gamma subunit [Helicobacter mustelae 12198]SQH71202.1 ATP synthase F1 sector subunit gamma [Helicobacter mustelae]STP12329.1 ATP synthase F1 sector subunit gamma [Helicobacter mustelae]
MGNNLKEIRKKIASVQNTQKTTRAMKLVSTSKLKKAEEMARQSRLYAEKLNEIFDDLIIKLKSRGLNSINSKYFSKSSQRDVKVIDIITITSDKGLCGGFNIATIKEAMRLKKEYESKGITVRIRGIGRKGIAYFSFHDIEVLDRVIGLSSMPDYERSAEFILRAIEDFIEGKTDEIILLHNGFKNMLTQELKSRVLVPFDLSAVQALEGRVHNVFIEPDDEEDRVLEELAKKYFEYNMYYSLIDSLAAEHGARMQAMDAATKNAGELVRSLTISYNKARQEAITTELVEINAGVEAMK